MTLPMMLILLRLLSADVWMAMMTMTLMLMITIAMWPCQLQHAEGGARSQCQAIRSAQQRQWL